MHYPWIAHVSWIFPMTRRVWHPKRIQTLVCIFTVIYLLSYYYIFIYYYLFIHILYRYFEGLSVSANAVLRSQFSGRWIAWLQATDEVKYGEEIIYDYGFDPGEASESESSSEDEFVPRSKRRKAVVKGNNTSYYASVALIQSELIIYITITLFV